MKQLTIFLLMIMPIIAFAQNYPGMSEADMQKMMQQMEKMQSCMEKIDEEQLKALEKRSNRLEHEVKALCDNGKRDEAQKKAIEFGKEIAKDPSMKQMRQCGRWWQRWYRKWPLLTRIHPATIITYVTTSDRCARDRTAR